MPKTNCNDQDKKVEEVEENSKAEMRELRFKLKADLEEMKEDVQQATHPNEDEKVAQIRRALNCNICQAVAKYSLAFA